MHKKDKLALQSSELLVLAYLYDVEQNEVPWRTPGYIALGTGYSERQVYRALRKLQAKKYVKVKAEPSAIGYGETTFYRVDMKVISPLAFAVSN